MTSFLSSGPSRPKKVGSFPVRKDKLLTVVQDDISEVSASSVSLEVTDEQRFQAVKRPTQLVDTDKKTAANSEKSRISCKFGRNGGGVGRFASLLGGVTRQSTNENLSVKKDNDHASVVSDTKSMYSHANRTVGSLETIKASNKTAKETQLLSSSTSSLAKKDRKKIWKKLKQMVGVNHNINEHSVLDGKHDNTSSDIRLRALTEESTSSSTTGSIGSPFRSQRRARSSPAANELTFSSARFKRHQQIMMDDSIRGRFDGIDILSLGNVQLLSPSSDGSSGQLLPWDTPTECSFTGQPTQWSPATIVLNAVWASSGRDPPEIILDGFLPGPDGRWSVRVMKGKGDVALKENSIPPPPPQPIENESTGIWWNFDSSSLSLQPIEVFSDDPDSPINCFRKFLFGSNPILEESSHVDTITTSSSADLSEGTSEDPMLDLAARCSIPIDLDEDTFIISTREHIFALHDIASASIARGNFQDALRIFETMLKGLASSTDIELRFMKGTVIHNMGMIQLWMGHLVEAVDSFNAALDERTKQLPPKHPDITVTLARKSAACFGVGRHGEAIAALKQALLITPSDHPVRAKLLNNLATIYYVQKDYGGALNELIVGLDIQEEWLEGPVRRESNVYETSITLCNMGKIAFETSDEKLALYLFEEALILETSIFRQDNPIVLSTLTNLAIAKAQKGFYGASLQILQGCIRAHNALHGVLSKKSMEIVGLSAYVYARKGDLDVAFKRLLTVRKWQKANLVENHTALLKSEQCLKAMEAKIRAKKVWI